jgi:phage tail tape-measure protein
MNQFSPQFSTSTPGINPNAMPNAQDGFSNLLNILAQSKQGREQQGGLTPGQLGQFAQILGQGGIFDGGRTSTVEEDEKERSTGSKIGGAATGALAGAKIGSIGGPIGAGIGSLIGGVGGFFG